MDVKILICSIENYMRREYLFCFLPIEVDNKTKFLVKELTAKEEKIINLISNNLVYNC